MRLFRYVAHLGPARLDHVDLDSRKAAWDAGGAARGGGGGGGQLTVNWLLFTKGEIVRRQVNVMLTS